MERQRARIEMVARVTLPDGRTIETSAESERDVADLADFDLETEGGFRRDYDDPGQGMVEAGKEAQRMASELFLEAAAEKRGQKRGG